ncbi:MAG: ABC transporter substrate-binding protein [Chloroflexota bacterium]
MKLRDRALVGLLSVALVVLSLAALGPSLQSSGLGNEPTPRTVNTRHFVEGVIGRVENASPFGARSVADRGLVALLFRGLVRLGPGSSIAGDLASSWDVADDGRTWTFHLRPDQYWEDGEPITADDVAFTVGVLSDPSYTGPGGESWRDVSASVLDPLTVQLQLTTPLGGFLEAATQPIAPVHLLGEIPPAELAEDPFGQNPVGSGPFHLVFLLTGNVMLAASRPVELLPEDPGGPNFATPRPTDSLASPGQTAKSGLAIPYLSQFELRYYDDVASLLDAWNKGELDAAAGLPPGAATELAATPHARLVTYPGTTALAIGLNLRSDHPEFNDPAVRRALLQAIDRDSIVSSLLAGLGNRADSLIPPSSPMFDVVGNAPVAFDATAARKALQTAGWKQSGNSWIPKGGKEPLVIELLSPEEAANPVAYETADAVVDAWQAIGLAVRHVPLSAAELIGDRLTRGEFQAAILPFAIGLDPDVYPLLAASQTRTGGSNVVGLQDPDLDKLLIAARTPVDEVARIAAYKTLQGRLQARTYMLPLAFRDEYVVFRDTVVGPESRAVGSSGDRYWDVLTWRLADGT